LINEQSAPATSGATGSGWNHRAAVDRARERALPLVTEGTDRVNITSTELIQAFCSHEFAATARAEKAEARVKELEAKLGDEEKWWKEKHDQSAQLTAQQARCAELEELLRVIRPAFASVLAAYNVKNAGKALAEIDAALSSARE